MYHKDTEFLVAKRLEALVLLIITLRYHHKYRRAGTPQSLDSYQPALPNG